MAFHLGGFGAPAGGEAGARVGGYVWHDALARLVEHDLRQHVSEEALRLHRRVWQVTSDDVDDGAGALANVVATPSPAAARTRRRSASAAHLRRRARRAGRQVCSAPPCQPRTGQQPSEVVAEAVVEVQVNTRFLRRP